MNPTRVEPFLDLSQLAVNGFLNGPILMVACCSPEDRCKSALLNLLGQVSSQLCVFLYEIIDDECKNADWSVRGRAKTAQNTALMLKALQGHLPSDRFTSRTYSMKERRSDVFQLSHDIDDLRHTKFGTTAPLCLLDISSTPSYFAVQLTKLLLDNNNYADIAVILTQPTSYPPSEELLKRAPLDITSPDFLPQFRQPHFEPGLTFDWIIALGFDFNSVRNAQRIKDQLAIGRVFPIVPFPGYKPEYTTRTLISNKDLLDKSEQYIYCAATNPFDTYCKVANLVQGAEDRTIISSFGPKPICLGLALLAMHFDLPFLHVQATEYNPDFSTGEGNSSVYFLRLNAVNLCFEE
jgi:hypothetical protein